MEGSRLPELGRMEARAEATGFVGARIGSMIGLSGVGRGFAEPSLELSAVAKCVDVEEVLGASGLQHGAVGGDMGEELGPLAGERGRFRVARVGELLDEAVTIAHGGEPLRRELWWGGVGCRSMLLCAEPSEGVRELALGVLELKRDEVALSLSGDDGVVDCGVAKARGCGGVRALAPNERAPEFDDRNAPGRRGRVGSVLFGHGEEGLGSTAVMRFEEEIESRCDQVA